MSSRSEIQPLSTSFGGRDVHRYGFNGQEKDDEINGANNSYTYEYRVHDPRLGRFLSIDPIQKEYPWNSTYAFAENRVIDGVDLEGREWSSTTATDKTTGATVVTLSVHIKVINASTVLSEAQIPDLMKEVSTQLSSTFTQMDATSNTSYVVSMSYEIVSEANEANDFAIKLQDSGGDYKKGLVKVGESTLGETQHQIIDVRCGVAGAPSPIASIANTVVHELGHTVGLEHPHQDNEIHLCANKYNSPNIENKTKCPDVYNQFKACIDYLKSANKNAVAPNMSIMENFMMQSAAIDELKEFYSSRDIPKAINISSANPSTGATIDQCKQAATTIESQDKD